MLETPGRVIGTHERVLDTPMYVSDTPRNVLDTPGQVDIKQFPKERDTVRPKFTDFYQRPGMPTWGYYLTECIDQLVLESQLPPQNVNSMFAFTN